MPERQRRKSPQTHPLPDLPPVSASEEARARSPSRARSAQYHARRRSLRQRRKEIQRSPRMRRFWFGVRLTLVAVVVVLIVGAVLLHRQVSTVADVIVVPEARPSPSVASPLLGGITLLLVGVDERPDHPEEGVRSDTLILAHLNAIGGWVNLLSIPRDTQVELDEVGITKINVAYGQGYARASSLYPRPGVTPQQGGMAFAAQTVERFFRSHGKNVRIDYTAQVNFDGFVGVIDALGGITVDVPHLIVDEAYPTPDFGTMYVEFQPGAQRMDGETALIYARTRHADSDFGRAQRQQQVIQAMVAEFRGKSWPKRIDLLPRLIESLHGHNGASPPIVTTLPIDRPDMLAGLLVLAGKLKTNSTGRIALTPETVPVTEVGSNLIWESEGIREQVNLLFRPPGHIPP